MALITLSTNTTIIESTVTTDSAINTILNDVGNITAVDGLSIIPISNTKAKLIMVWH